MKVGIVIKTLFLLLIL